MKTARLVVIPSCADGEGSRTRLSASLATVGSSNACDIPRRAAPARDDSSWGRAFGFGFRSFCVLCSLLLIGTVCAAPRFDNLIDIRAVDPTIVVDLRYATADNVTGHPLYPPGSPALVRPTTAARLVKAQQFLRAHHYGLKIWDAYRPLAAQLELWERTHNGAYVADPAAGNGSLHSWGVAVDATLVDADGNDVAMPTKFDEFSSTAKLRYQGNDPEVKRHLRLLQLAMRAGGFYGMRTEWWHFVAYDWKKYAPMREAKRIAD